MDKYPVLDHSADHIIETGRLFHNNVGVFEAACKDFTALQRIDYRKAFHCPHNKFVMDGTTIGPRKARCHTMRPWKQTELGEIVRGESPVALPALRIMRNLA